MFSVNIDKLVSFTPNERMSYNELGTGLETELVGKKCLAVTKNALAAFRIAYCFASYGKKVLFVDGDIDCDTFLGKYKLGKNLKGVADYMKDPGVADSLVCKTNERNLDVIFTGTLDDGVISEDELTETARLIAHFSPVYDCIVVCSDASGRLAKYCDKTVVVYDESEYDELAARNYISELKNNRCDVLGVVISE